MADVREPQIHDEPISIKPSPLKPAAYDGILGTVIPAFSTQNPFGFDKLLDEPRPIPLPTFSLLDASTATPTSTNPHTASSITSLVPHNLEQDEIEKGWVWPTSAMLQPSRNPNLSNPFARWNQRSSALSVASQDCRSQSDIASLPRPLGSPRLLKGRIIAANSNTTPNGVVLPLIKSAAGAPEDDIMSLADLESRLSVASMQINAHRSRRPVAGLRKGRPAPRRHRYGSTDLSQRGTLPPRSRRSVSPRMRDEAASVSTGGYSRRRHHHRVTAYSPLYPPPIYPALMPPPGGLQAVDLVMSPVASRSMLTCSPDFRKQFPYVYQALCKGIIDVQRLIAHEIVVPIKEDVSLRRSTIRSRKGVTSAITDALWRSLQGRFPDATVGPKLIRKMADYIYDKIEYGIQDAEDERSFLQWFFRFDVENAIDLLQNLTLQSGKNSVLCNVEGSAHLKRRKGELFNLVSPDVVILNVECVIKALFLNGGHLSEMNSDSMFIDRVQAGENRFAHNFLML